MNKEQKHLFGSGVVDSNVTYNNLVHVLNCKYYNIFRSNFKITGLNYREQNYLMNKFYRNGTVAAFKIKHADTLGFSPWARVTWDMYGEPETINLVNEYGSPLVPSGVQTVDKDVVIGYIQSNRKPLQLIVNWYVERIAQVEMVINTNLQLQKLPYLIPVDGNDKSAEKKKLQDVVQKILNNEIVIFAEGFDARTLTAIKTEAPYLIDKLTDYEKSLENGLLTYLGVQNCNTVKQEQLQLAEINSNNEEINLSDGDFQNCLDDFCERVKETLGKTISIKVSQADAKTDGEYHDYENKKEAEEADEVE